MSSDNFDLTTVRQDCNAEVADERRLVGSPHLASSGSRLLQGRDRLIGTELKLRPPQSCYVLPPGLIVDFRIGGLTHPSAPSRPSTALGKNVLLLGPPRTRERHGGSHTREDAAYV